MNGLSYSFFLNIKDYIGPFGRRMKLLNKIKARPGVYKESKTLLELVEAGVVENKNGQFCATFKWKIMHAKIVMPLVLGASLGWGATPRYDLERCFASEMRKQRSPHFKRKKRIKPAKNKH